MSRKRYTPEQIISMLREAEVALAQGQSIGQACRTLGVSEQSYYRWRKEYGGLRTDQVKRLKDLEKENGRLRKAISDLTLDKLILKVNRPRFTGERLVQILGCFFMCVQGFIEHLLCFVRRDISDGAVKTLGVVPIDPFQRFPFKLAH